MPRDLFGDLTRPSLSIGNRKWYTVPLSLLTHSAIVVALIALPVLAPAMLPAVLADDNATWITTVLPPPPPPPKLRPADAKPMANPDAAPVSAPNRITPETPVELDTSFQNTTATTIVGGPGHTERLIAALPPAPAAPPAPVRVGGQIRAPQRVREVVPVYPAIAQAARVQGIVIIEATIGEDGQVMNARVLRSVPLLDQAALEAVRQWHYTPTLLNGVPVPVIMSVTVQFTLSR